MKTKKNLSIKTKLLMGFMFITALLCLTGILGAYGMSRIQDDASLIYNKNLNNINTLHSLKEDLLEIRYQATNAASSENADTTKSAKETVASIIASYEDSIGDIRQDALIQEDSENYEKFKMLSRTYTSQVQGILDLCSTGAYAKAQTRITGIYQTRDEMFSLINGLIESNQNLADKEYSRSMKAFSDTLDCEIIVIAIGLIAALGIGIGLSYYISNITNRGMKLAKALSEKDLTYSIESKSTDELGHLLRSLEKAKDKIREVVVDISEESRDVMETSQELYAIIEELSATVDCINGNTENIVAHIDEISVKTKDLYEEIAEIENKMCITGSGPVMMSGESLEMINAAAKCIAENLSLVSDEAADILINVGAIATTTEEITLSAHKQTAVSESLNLIIQSFRL